MEAARMTPEASSSSQPLPGDSVPQPAPPPSPPATNGVPTIAKQATAPAGRQMAGMKPVVPLRKRGASFKETSSVITMVDANGARHLNQYTFLEELGRGAYGLVLKVEANDTQELLAAKIVNKKALKRIRVGRFGNALQSVKKELGIWRKFKHRHIVVLREVIDTDDSDELYMISELVEGGPVLDGELECTPLGPEETKLYFCHLIEGVDFLHENKVIHRDIKPGNLLLKKFDDGETVLKLADFGVSHEMENDNDSLRTTAGTAIFMAPEMLTGESFQGRPVDIWACGITLYMFVYGHPPFVAKTLTELYGLIQNEPILYPDKVGERVVEPPLLDLLQHILEKDPTKRYTITQIRAHPWAWNDFQVSALKCVTHPEGRRSSFSKIPKTMSGVASVGRSLRSIFGRSKPVHPVAGQRASITGPSEVQQ